MVHDAEEFGAVGESPVVVRGEFQAGGIFLGLFEGHFAAISFLPCEAGDVVGDGAVAVVGEAGIVSGEVSIFAEGLRVARCLAGIGKM